MIVYLSYPTISLGNFMPSPFFKSNIIIIVRFCWLNINALYISQTNRQCQSQWILRRRPILETHLNNLFSIKILQLRWRRVGHCRGLKAGQCTAIMLSCRHSITDYTKAIPRRKSKKSQCSCQRNNFCYWLLIFIIYYWYNINL